KASPFHLIALAILQVNLRDTGRGKINKVSQSSFLLLTIISHLSLRILEELFVIIYISKESIILQLIMMS
ncbi:hypothetical protein ACJX0J_025174, partial [Zea mays]